MKLTFDRWKLLLALEHLGEFSIPDAQHLILGRKVTSNKEHKAYSASRQKARRLIEGILVKKGLVERVKNRRSREVKFRLLFPVAEIAAKLKWSPPSGSSVLRLTSMRPRAIWQPDFALSEPDAPSLQPSSVTFDIAALTEFWKSLEAFGTERERMIQELRAENARLGQKTAALDADKRSFDAEVGTIQRNFEAAEKRRKDLEDQMSELSGIAQEIDWFGAKSEEERLTRLRLVRSALNLVRTLGAKPSENGEYDRASSSLPSQM